MGGLFQEEKTRRGKDGKGKGERSKARKERRPAASRTKQQEAFDDTSHGNRRRRTGGLTRHAAAARARTRGRISARTTDGRPRPRRTRRARRTTRAGSEPTRS